ncbi:MAG: phytoene desaturase [Bacteroidetes bacterium]|nr:phytoene desaturase [Bacteroidota bacterium]
MQKSVIVIGSGFSGLSAASFMAKAGWKVIVIEKNSTPGGRAKQLKQDGFTFDMGPSWYWMPDVFDRFFKQFDKKTADYYQLVRLDPSYRVYWENDFSDIPASYDQLKKLFESIEPGSSKQLDKYLQEAAYKYNVGVGKLVYKPGLSLAEFLDWETIKGIFRLDVFTSIQRHVHQYFKNDKLRRLMEFPVLFLGALPSNTPALYSLMNYADIKGGTWYPNGGMYSVVKGMYQLALELGVTFSFDETVREIVVQNSEVINVVSDQSEYRPDALISSADYHFTETILQPSASRSYPESYWNKRVMAPSCLLYYIGLNKKLHNVKHHSLFFDVPFDQHADEIYSTPKWPTHPLFYVSVNSVSDPSVAPPGCDTIVFLIPVAAGLTGDTEELKREYFDIILQRMENRTGQNIKNSIVFYKSYSVSDFVNDYNSYKGNAYGLANTLRQTAILRPSCRSKKVKNLFYSGQSTVPGPGVPPALISGEVTAREVLKSFQ